ncbi:hypothetical protein SD70_27140 [Gordoniibacillus kamchatkensis]|uniref:Hemolysin XhlA n=1 Tax=Gordoniibacillus kamchatkensis TaxID=1590651 RepID=A0ABR5AB57_9BACL|nr:hypothetical protein SD70_27140 [Paenibacillus sp. VKM B-2647]
MSDTQTLEHRLTSLEKEQEAQGKRIGAIEGEIKDIVKLLSARPTWLITSLITILTTVTASLIVYVTTHH